MSTTIKLFTIFFAAFGMFGMTGCKKDPSLPTLTTTTPTSITDNSASIGGYITEDGGAAVTDRGICYGTTSLPTIANSVVTSGIGTGNFTCNLPSLNAGTMYYARAYAKNSAGISYGNEVSFTTRVLLGQIYGGGYVFYIDNTGNHGLSAALNDSGTAAWGCYGTDISGAYSAAIGGGAANTNAITQVCSGNIAALICANLAQNGYDDWYLPTSGELTLVYQNLYQQGIGNFLGQRYWSSTGYSANFAYMVDFNAFNPGNVSWDGKNDVYTVRAVRAF